MSDLSPQGLLQQLNARPVSGQELEVLGKHAATGWQAGQYTTLTQAVVETVKEARLAPEQVRRVIEFANTSAYLDAFNKEGSPHKVIDFEGGPANPSDVLKDLNDGGGGSVFDRGTLDYEQPPPETKVASGQQDAALFALFGTSTGNLPEANPFSPAMDLRDKLASALEHQSAEVSGIEIMYADLADRVYHQVKQAALNGTSLGEITQAWATVAPSDAYIKVAFQLLAPRLLRDQVFRTPEEMFGSVDKTAGVRQPNPEHPMLVDFGEFCTVLSTLAEKRAACGSVRVHLGQIETFLKKAAASGHLTDGVYGLARKASKGLADTVAPLAGAASRGLIGGTGETAQAAAHGVLRHSHNIALGLGAAEGGNWVNNSPHPVARGARGAANVVARNIPGTPQNYQHQWELQNGQ